jgi:nucleotide-binding universal stress UspA family protein
MATLQRILCPIDFSDCSAHALNYAVAIARATGASVTAFLVAPGTAPTPMMGSPLYPPMVFSPDDLEQFRHEVDTFVTSQNAGASIDTVAVAGNPVPEIVGMSERLPADLLVMGTHGRSGFDRLMLGSVTEKVLRRAMCPVLTVPPRVPDAVSIGGPIFSRILCAIDFSPSSLKALEYARSFAREAGSRLCLAHVVEPVSVFDPVMADASGAAIVDDRLAKESAHHRLDDLARGVPEAVSEVVTSGKPYRELLRLAAEQQSDLIVIGVHGGLSGVLAFGSTTNQIVRQATCPVLSLRA